MKRPNKYDFDFGEDYESNLETYCDELEVIVSKGDCVSHYENEIQRLEKAFYKACEELDELDKSHAYEINKQIVEKKGSSTITFGYQKKEEWKEWCMEND